MYLKLGFECKGNNLFKTCIFLYPLPITAIYNNLWERETERKAHGAHRQNYFRCGKYIGRPTKTVPTPNRCILV